VQAAAKILPATRRQDRRENVGRITDKKRENLEETIKTGVPNFFSSYPFVAGNPNPVTEQ